ncbi:hypothetical protein [Tateyamaria sp. ANG-S1]|uniref:hypothetical protein n=1 Tax=Tateyamaria sp. ANG-S1 TaxID=1577905 RepID=UPI00057FCB6E|nr:hypothetical protein [Tateyamaria sp. ANG-S1]KIC51769.1 hypothetical protein RA29_00170 [Tateyamaria sp. ANG-S1]
MILTGIIAMGLIVVAAWLLPPYIKRALPLPEFLFGMVCTSAIIGIAAVMVLLIQAMGLPLPIIGPSGDAGFANALLSLSMPSVGVLVIRLAQLRGTRP